MRLSVPREHTAGETRIPLIPEHVKRLGQAGLTVSVASGLGTSVGFSDEEYRSAGAEVLTDHEKLLSEADIMLRIHKPLIDEIPKLKKGCISISLLDPFNDRETIAEFAKQGVSTVSLEMIPRITRAQKMDVLSSQASLGGYVAVITAAERLNRVFPMMMTPAGTIKPARVFVVGAGVAGLQAIATAKRLGARVEAFDTRPVVEEQVRSLGARFVTIDIGETGESKDGYAKALTPEQLEKQREGMAKVCASSDIVITTAQVFGKRAPLIITGKMVGAMQPGAIIVDMAVENGGNVEGSKLNEAVETNGVTIIGYPNLAGRVPYHASQMFSANLFNFVSEFLNKEEHRFEVKPDDEIMKNCLITHDNTIVNAMIRDYYEKNAP